MGCSCLVEDGAALGVHGDESGAWGQLSQCFVAAAKGSARAGRADNRVNPRDCLDDLADSPLVSRRIVGVPVLIRPPCIWNL